MMKGTKSVTARRKAELFRGIVRHAVQGLISQDLLSCKNKKPPQDLPAGEILEAVIILLSRYHSN